MPHLISGLCLYSSFLLNRPHLSKLGQIVPHCILSIFYSIEPVFLRVSRTKSVQYFIKSLTIQDSYTHVNDSLSKKMVAQRVGGLSIIREWTEPGGKDLFIPRCHNSTRISGFCKLGLERLVRNGKLTWFISEFRPEE